MKLKLKEAGNSRWIEDESGAFVCGAVAETYASILVASPDLLAACKRASEQESLAVAVGAMRSPTYLDELNDAIAKAGSPNPEVQAGDMWWCVFTDGHDWRAEGYTTRDEAQAYEDALDYCQTMDLSIKGIFEAASEGEAIDKAKEAEDGDDD